MYWGLRDYQIDGQIGLEPTPELYVAKMVEVFREVKRVLRKDGTVWCNLGDTYTSAPNNNAYHKSGDEGSGLPNWERQHQVRVPTPPTGRRGPGLKPKDLCGIPWRVAFALQADGWWLRQDIIWHKPNPMPESVTDRCTKAHEYVFLLTKSATYFYDAEAVREPAEYGRRIWPTGGHDHYERSVGTSKLNPRGQANTSGSGDSESGRNRRSVWTIPSQAYSEAHFATFPEALVKPCVLAGTSARGCCPKCGAPWERVVEQSRPTDYEGKGILHGNDGNGMRMAEKWNTESKTTGWEPGCRCAGVDDRPGLIFEQQHPEFSPIPCTVLDPFGGSGTTGQVAIELGRNAILIELNPAYAALARQRTNTTPGLNLA